MKKVILYDKTFSLYIKNEDIDKGIKKCAVRLNEKFSESKTAPIMISLLNGAAFFTVDLIKHIDFLCSVDFIKCSSYCGTESTGQLIGRIDLKSPIEGEDVIIVDDIIDSGYTISEVIKSVEKMFPKSITIVTMIYKPNSVKVNVNVDCFAIEMLDNPFIVGYGLDYNELGRTLKDIYILDK